MNVNRYQRFDDDIVSERYDEINVLNILYYVLYTIAIAITGKRLRFPSLE